MKLITPIQMPHSTREIDYNSRLCFMGSCFAGNIGTRFKDIKIHTVVNPFGTLFNPYSVMDIMERVLYRRYFTRDDFFQSGGVYLSMSLHSDHSYADIDEALREVNALIDSMYDELSKATHLFFTFGTSQVYRYKKTGLLCANCHKIPQREFSVERMSVEEISSMCLSVQKALRDINPSLAVYYTVSPVRYMGEGALGASVSKARLFCAIDDVLAKSPDSDTFYLPSYEILMDELRDYRYYAADMLHPNELAVEYIWERVSEMFFSPQTQRLCDEVREVLKAAQHRPFNPEGEQYQAFCVKNMERIVALEEKCPYSDFSAEKALFASRIKP